MGEYRKANEQSRGGEHKVVGSKPHNCRDYWELREYLEATQATEEIQETLEKFVFEAII